MFTFETENALRCLFLLEWIGMNGDPLICDRSCFVWIVLFVILLDWLVLIGRFS